MLKPVIVCRQLLCCELQLMNLHMNETRRIPMTMQRNKERVSESWTESVLWVWDNDTESVGVVQLAALALSKHVWLGHIWERERERDFLSAGALPMEWAYLAYRLTDVNTHLYIAGVLNLFDMKSHPEPFTNMNSVVLDDGLCFPVCNTRE